MSALSIKEAVYFAQLFFEVPGLRILAFPTYK